MAWWVVNKQINKDSLVSLPMKNFLISEYLAKLQAKKWLSHALLPDEQSA